MDERFDYLFEDSDLGVTEVSPDDVEKVRRGEWRQEFPEVEYAEAIGPNGKPGRLTRVPKYK